MNQGFGTLVRKKGDNRQQLLCLVRLQRALKAAFYNSCETSLMGRSLNPTIQNKACRMVSKVMMAKLKTFMFHNDVVLSFQNPKLHTLCTGKSFTEL